MFDFIFSHSFSAICRDMWSLHDKFVPSDNLIRMSFIQSRFPLSQLNVIAGGNEWESYSDIVHVFRNRQYIYKAVVCSEFNI